VRRLLPLALLVAAGCGGPAPAPPAVTLVVTLDGSPAARLNVQLVGPDGAAVAAGGTDDAGRAAVRAAGDKLVPPGTYKVVVTDLGDAEENPMEPARKAAAKARVPAAYGKPATTPATVTVEAGKTEYPVAVKSK
jgi:hypothetical protein